MGASTCLFRVSQTALFRGKQTVALNTVVLGRFLNPDDYVQLPDLSQSLNRYSYCLNNPLKYTDPSGESFLLDDVIVGAIGFATGYFTNSISSGNWGMKSVMAGLSSAGLSVLSYNTSGMAVGALNKQFWVAAAQIGVNNILGSVLPSKTFEATDHFSLSISPLIGIGQMGFSLGASYSFGFHYDDWSFGFGIGGGNGYIGFNTSVYDASANFGFGYGRTAYEECWFNENFIDAQTVGTISLSGKGWSFSLSNDLFGEKHQDRGRTSAAELCIGNFVIGTNILTNNGNEASNGYVDGDETKTTFKHIKTNKRYKKRDNTFPSKAGSWLNGQVYHSPFWIGYKNGNMTCRVGYSNEIIQKYTQNFVHKFMSTPFFNHYDSFHRGLYFSMGNHNPYSLW